jgi:hypothetical protein
VASNAVPNFVTEAANWGYLKVQTAAVAEHVAGGRPGALAEGQQISAVGSAHLALHGESCAPIFAVWRPLLQGGKSGPSGWYMAVAMYHAVYHLAGVRSVSSEAVLDYAKGRNNMICFYFSGRTERDWTESGEAGKGQVASPRGVEPLLPG